ncbi:hypothetical protein HNE_3422 [Hyphomonas neptunium ATCC 15444]|uniref:Uncharacterized protein n=1 Tax=Hyphomonas neptunium (strain ATCC 15444) TaxID=228405 RepID=Q0BWP8_HYPNA|nr:hypothetical protein HNE_3422 [Hyphomonas neptunium ATCC 15444]
MSLVSHSSDGLPGFPVQWPIIHHAPDHPATDKPCPESV